MRSDHAETNAAKGEDSVEKTRSAVLSLISEHPDMDTIYNVAGGNLGLAEGLRESRRAEHIVVIIHEANAITIPLIREGIVSFLIALSPRALLKEALQAAKNDGLSGPEYRLVDFTIHTQFNLPCSF